MDDITDELIDRFGDFPTEVEKIILVSYLKMLAKKERVEKVTEKGKSTELIVEDERSQLVDGSKLFTLANEFGRNVQLGTVNNKLKVVFKWTNESISKRYEIVCSFIEQ